jgi:hypothetical protein
MKRWAIVLLLLMLLVGGCSEETPPPAEMENEPQVVETEKASAVARAEAPKRDPLAAVSGSKKTGEAAEISTEGRNPFTVEKAGKDWATEKGKVDTSGRDPFVKGKAGKPAAPAEKPPKDPTPGTETPVTEDGVTVQLTTLDRCWLEVFVDKKRVLLKNVPAAETLTWQGQKEVYFAQVGRGWAVEITVNGQKLGVLSEFAKDLKDGPQVVAGVQISLRHIYPGEVLVGLSLKKTD